MTPESPYQANALAIRCTPDLVGDSAVYVRFFDDETRNEWKELQKRTRRGGPEQVPYSIATTALRVLTGGYVHLDRNLEFLASKEPISDARLLRIFTYLEGYARGLKTDDIPLHSPPALARLIAQAKERRHLLAEHLKPELGKQPNAPGWVYQTVTWDLARRLAARPFDIYELVPLRKPDSKGKLRTYDYEQGEKRKILYVPDSNGDLISWHDPFGRTFNGADPGDGHRTVRDAQYAMSRISLSMKTQPNIATSMLMLDAHVTRVYSNLVYAKTALVEQSGAGLPLLRVDLIGGGGLRTVNRLALEVLAHLNMNDSVLQEIERRSALEREIVKSAREQDQKPSFTTPEPGIVRPIMPKNYPFAVGTGAGIHHLRLLAAHIDDVFGEEAVHLDMPRVEMQFARRPTDTLTQAEKKRREEAGESTDTVGFPHPDDVHRAIEAAGAKRLRLLCLWYRQETRLRLINCLARAYSLDPATLDPPRGEEVFLTTNVSVVFHDAEAFLQHGPNQGRREAMAPFKTYLNEESVLVAALCETEFPQKPKKEKGDTQVSLALKVELIDAKYQTKRILSEHCLSTQYLKGLEKGKFGAPDSVIQPTKDDYPAYMALLDLYRSLGIIDQRIEEALKPADGEPELPRMAFCGIHVRKQTRTPGVWGEPKRIVIAAALVPSSQPDGVWTLLGWTSIEQQWKPYREAEQVFHAADYPEHRRGDDKTDDQRWAEAAQDIEQALADLWEYLDGMPYAVIVDGHACRRIWPGLHNKNQSLSPEDLDDPRIWLPGNTLPERKRPLGIIRLNTQPDEVPQAVSITHTKKDGTTREIKVSPQLYRRTPDFGTPSWILFNVPRNYDGSGGGRLGSTKTRWHADPGKSSENAGERERNELKAPWYTMTATEIYPVAVSSSVSREALAIATARLCHQTISWSDRSRYPAPLHAAKQMDLDHPQYRRSAPPDELPQPEEEEFAEE